MTRDYFDITHDPTGWINEDGSRAPMWSSGDVRPAQSLGHLMAHALEQGYGTDTKFRLPDAEDAETLGKIYQREFKRYPRHYLAFQREQKVRDILKNSANPYGITIPGAGKYGRSDYGQGNL